MSIYEKLATVQQTLVAKKDKWNAFSKYKYRSAEGILEALKPLLKQHKLLMLSNNEQIMVGDRYYIKTTIKLYDVANDADKKDPIIVSACARESEQLKGQISAQISGGTQSYAFKYALNSMFLIDDGNGDADSQNTQENMENPKQETLSSFLKQHDVKAKDFVSHFMINAKSAKELLTDKPKLENMVKEYKQILANNAT